MTISMKQLADKIEELAKKYPDRNPSCSYAKREKTGLTSVCVVGCAVLDLAGEEGLEKLGRVNLTQIQQILVPTRLMYDAVGEQEAKDREEARKLFEDVLGKSNGNSPYVKFVQGFQISQDQGINWGDAYSINKYLLDVARAQEKS